MSKKKKSKDIDNEELSNEYEEQNLESETAEDIDDSDDQAYKIIFWERIAPLVKQFAKEVAVKPETKLNYQINVNMMWFHRMDKGDYDNWHNHSYCQWVGVYYVDLKDGQQTLLQDHQGNIYQPDVKEGQLIIFPSSYMHKSPDVTDRKTMKKTDIIVIGKANEKRS